MALVHWRPFPFDDFMEEASRVTDLATDVYEENSNIIVKMHIPGIDPDKVDIAVENEYLHVSGTREEREESEDQDYYRKEIRTGSFERVLTLPVAVDEANTRARYQDGVLTISLPKKETAEKRSRIQIERD